MMRHSHQVTANVEEIADKSVHGQESLCLPGRCEPSHVSLAVPCGLVGNFGAVVLVPVRTVSGGRHDRSVCSPVAVEFVGDQPPYLANSPIRPENWISSGDSFSSFRCGPRFVTSIERIRGMRLCASNRCQFQRPRKSGGPTCNCPA